MFRQVLVPVSFSGCDVQLARYAGTLARAIGGSVTLLHVLEPSAQALDSRLDAAQQLLARLSLLARRPPTCRIAAASGPPGEDVAPVILRVAAEIGADVIMLGLREVGLRKVDRPDLDAPDTTRQAAGLAAPATHRPGQVLRQVLLGTRVPVQIVPCFRDDAAPVLGRWDPRATALVPVPGRDSGP
jgi:nucleotide-binding universal stress UspA family protein